MCDDYTNAVNFKEWMESNGHQFRYCPTKELLYWYNPENNGIWKPIPTNDKPYEFRNYIAKCPDIERTFRTSVSNQNNCTTMLLPLVQEIDFEEESHKKQHGKIPFRNGVYDFDTKELLPFDARMYLTDKLDIDYNPDIQDNVCDQVKQLVYDSFGVEGDYTLETIARALAGRIQDKHFGMMVGNRHSGNSIFVNIVRNTFAKFCSIVNADIFQKNKINTKKARSWIYANRAKRIVFFNKADNVQLCGRAIKIIANDDSMINLNDDGETFNAQFTVFGMMNDISKIHDFDNNVYRRVKVTTTKSQYPTEPGYIERKDVQEAFAMIVLRAYTNTKPKPPPSVLSNTSALWAHK